jgi:hypothetical protein
MSRRNRTDVYNPPKESHEVRKELPQTSGRGLFTLLTLVYLGGEGFHFLYNIEVINQLKENQYYP